MPSEAPICWEAATVADATPASSGRTLRAALFIEVENANPSPMPLSGLDDDHLLLTRMAVEVVAAARVAGRRP